MNIQIMGTKKCSDTKKAERFFKERRIQFHFRDITEKEVSPGEFNKITQKIDLDELIDRDGKQYKKRGLEFMVFNIEEELMSDPLLFRTPIVRNGHLVTVGYAPNEWKEWIK